MAVSACVWSVSINGNRLPIERKKHINQIEVQENCNGSDTASITVFDKNMEYINDNIYVQDATISISMRFVGIDETVNFNGFISAIDIDFPEEGVPTLVLHCMDASHVMNRVKKKRSWKSTTRMSVAQKIAQEYGFKFEGESSYNGDTKDTITQSSQTDIEFLEHLAAQEKPELYMCKLVGDTIIYKKRGMLDTPVVEVHYKRFPYEVRSFSPQINKETMEEESSVSDIATDTKKEDTATSSGTNKAQGDAVSGIAGKASFNNSYNYTSDNATQVTRNASLSYQGSVDKVTGGVTNKKINFGGK